MKVAIIDSGVNAAHPHVRSVAGGISATDFEGWTDDFSDRLGHGTAVAGVIREKAPNADLFSIKVFDRRLSAHPAQIVRALEWCRFHRMDVINLSVCLEDGRRSAEIKRAAEGLLVVSVARGLPGAIGVNADDSCPRDEFYYREGVFHASPYPRPEAAWSFKGVDFAVANMTGFVTRVLPSIIKRGGPAEATRKSLLRELIALGEVLRS